MPSRMHHSASKLGILDLYRSGHSQVRCTGCTNVGKGGVLPPGCRCLAPGTQTLSR